MEQLTAILTVLLVMLLVACIVSKRRSGKLNRKWKIIRSSVKNTFNFMFKLKSEERLEAFRKIHKAFPRFLHIDFLGLQVLMVYDPQIVKRVFSSVHLMQRPFRNFVPLDKGLLFSTYVDWREPRKHLNLAFNLNVLKGFIPIFSDYSDITIKEMEEHVQGEEFDLLPIVAKLILRTVSGIFFLCAIYLFVSVCGYENILVLTNKNLFISRQRFVLFGIPFHDNLSLMIIATLLNVHRIELSSFEKLNDSINTLGECLFMRMSNPLLHQEVIYKLTPTYQREKVALDFLLQYGNEFKLIDEARKRHSDPLSAEERNEGSRTKINFIVDQLINHEEKYSDREIREHLLTLQITASDTTTNLVAACVLFLAMNQEIQTKVYDEIFTVLQDDDNIDYERLNELKYLDLVLKETLRLCSPIPISMREAIEDCDVGTGKTLKRGTKVFILNYVLHQRKDIWGESCGSFNPDNFATENCSGRDPYAFVPFGSGARNCIGNRYTIIAAKVFITKLSKAFAFKTKLKEKDMTMKLSFTGKLSTKYLVSIENR